MARWRQATYIEELPSAKISQLMVTSGDFPMRKRVMSGCGQENHGHRLVAVVIEFKTGAER
jgi:hypothetical protein